MLVGFVHGSGSQLSLRVMQCRVLRRITPPALWKSPPGGSHRLAAYTPATSCVALLALGQLGFLSQFGGFGSAYASCVCARPHPAWQQSPVLLHFMQVARSGSKLHFLPLSHFGSMPCMDSGPYLGPAFPRARREAHGHHLTRDSGNVGTRTPVLHVMVPELCSSTMHVFVSVAQDSRERIGQVPTIGYTWYPLHPSSHEHEPCI